LPWKSVLNRQCGMALISATSQSLSRTHAVSVIAMRLSVQLRAWNSQVMLCLPMSKRSVPSFGAYNPDRHCRKEEPASHRDTLTEVHNKEWQIRLKSSARAQRLGLRLMVAIKRTFPCP